MVDVVTVLDGFTVYSYYINELQTVMSQQDHSYSRENRSYRRVIVMGCIVSSTKEYFRELAPRTSGCNLNWRQNICRNNQVKMKPVGWDLIQYDQCPCKWGKVWTQKQTYTQEKYHLMVRIMLPQGKELPGSRREVF